MSRTQDEYLQPVGPGRARALGHLAEFAQHRLAEARLKAVRATVLALVANVRHRVPDARYVALNLTDDGSYHPVECFSVDGLPIPTDPDLLETIDHSLHRRDLDLVTHLALDRRTAPSRHVSDLAQQARPFPAPDYFVLDIEDLLRGDATPSGTRPGPIHPSPLPASEKENPTP